MNDSINCRRQSSHAFSSPNFRTPLAGLDGSRRQDRRVGANGFPDDDAAGERRRSRQNRLRAALVHLIGSEQEFCLLLAVATDEISLRKLAAQTSRDVSVICRRYPKYLEQLRELARNNQALNAALSEFLDGGIR